MVVELECSPRDSRRTFKTLAGSIRIDLEPRNRLQGHAMTNVASVHYDRWGYLPENAKRWRSEPNGSVQLSAAPSC